MLRRLLNIASVVCLVLCVALMPSCLGFEASQNSSMTSIIVPLWFLVLTTGSLAMAFQLRWPLRFTLRGLFV
jgi:hypothetical protein